MNIGYQNALQHFTINGWPGIPSSLHWSVVHRSDTDCRITLVVRATVEYIRVYEFEVGAVYPKADGRWHWSGDWKESGSEETAYQAVLSMYDSLQHHLSQRKWPT